MSDLRTTGSEGRSLNLKKNNVQATVGTGLMKAPALRQKPGPKKKIESRSEKISCRLTRSEKVSGESYCKAHGITEAKLLRASYLAAITQTPDNRINGLAEAIAQLPNKSNVHIKEVLKKSGLILLLTLLCGFAAPVAAKYALQVYQFGRSIVYHAHESCIYHTEEPGCEMIPDDGIHLIP